MANDADDEAIAIKVGGPIVAVPPIVFNGACKMGVKIRCEKAATTAGLTLSPIFTTQPNPGLRESDATAVAKCVANLKA